MLVQNGVAVFLKNFEKGRLIIGIAVLGELCVGEEIFAIDSEVSGAAWGQGSEVDGVLSGLHSATETGL